MHRIVVNAALDRMRRKQVRPSVALPDDLDGRIEVATVRDAHDDALIALDVQAALATLVPEQRAALVLVDIIGHSVEEAAAILECPTGTVKSRCSRGRARLLPLLEHLRNREGTGGVETVAVKPAADPAEPEGGDRR